MENKIEELFKAFDELVQDALQLGLPTLSFLEENLIAETSIALVELAVFCRQQFVKIMILQDTLERKLADQADKSGEIKMGAEGFQRNG